MTFEEIQKIIEQMLAVQRELQNGQLKLQEGQEEFKERQEKLQAAQERHERILDRHERVLERQERILDGLISYSFRSESAQFDLEEQLAALERRVKRVENQADGT